MRKVILVGLMVGLMVGAAWGREAEGLDLDFWNMAKIAQADSGGLRARDIVSTDYFWGRWSLAIPAPAAGDSNRVDFFVLDGTSGSGAATCILSQYFLRTASITDFARADSVWVLNTNTGASADCYIFVTGSKDDQSKWEGGRK